MRGQKDKRVDLSVDVVGLSSCMCGAENWLKEVVVEGDRGES